MSQEAEEGVVRKVRREEEEEEGGWGVRDTVSGSCTNIINAAVSSNQFNMWSKIYEYIGLLRGSLVPQPELGHWQ